GADRAPWRRRYAAPTSSSCWVVIPGRTASRMCRNVFATSFPTARIAARSPLDWMVIRRPGADSKSHLAFANDHCLSPDPGGGRLAVLLVDFDLENAWTAHLEALFDDPTQRTVRLRIARREIAAERNAGTARRGILGDVDQGRVHAR